MYLYSNILGLNTNIGSHFQFLILYLSVSSLLISLKNTNNEKKITKFKYKLNSWKINTSGNVL